MHQEGPKQHTRGHPWLQDPTQSAYARLTYHVRSEESRLGSGLHGSTCMRRSLARLGFVRVKTDRIDLEPESNMADLSDPIRVSSVGSTGIRRVSNWAAGSTENKFRLVGPIRSIYTGQLVNPIHHSH